MRLAPPLVHDNTQYNIVVVGDSIDGVNYGNWQTIISQSFNRKKIRIVNLAVDGIRVGGTILPTMLNNTTAVDAAVLPNAVNILMMGGGTNDICAMATEGRTTTDIYNDIISYITGRAGYDYFVWRPILPRTQPACSAVGAGTFEPARQAINPLMHTYASTHPNVFICECDTDPDIGLAGCSNDTDFYETDKVHLNPNGAAVMAGHQVEELNNILLP